MTGGPFAGIEWPFGGKRKPGDPWFKPLIPNPTLGFGVGVDSCPVSVGVDFDPLKWLKERREAWREGRRQRWGWLQGIRPFAKITVPNGGEITVHPGEKAISK